VTRAKVVADKRRGEEGRVPAGVGQAADDTEHATPDGRVVDRLGKDPSDERRWHQRPKPDLVARENLLLGLRIRLVEQKILNVVSEAGTLADEELAHGVRHLGRQDEHHRVPVDLVPLANGALAAGSGRRVGRAHEEARDGEASEQQSAPA
jgi:hypothetical protein